LIIDICFPETFSILKALALLSILIRPLGLCAQATQPLIFITAVYIFHLIFTVNSGNVCVGLLLNQQ